MSRAQNLGGQHRRQAKRQEGGEGHGRRDRRRELYEQTPDISGQEQQGREDRQQHDGRGHDREEDLARATLGGDQRRLAVVQTTLNVLDHHDGVIDHEADGQNQGQQRQQVQREAQRRQDDEGRQQTDRRHDRRDQRSPQAAQEDEVHQGHQGHGDADGDPDLVDGVRGEDRVVGSDLDGHARRQGRPDFLDHLVDTIRDGEVVRLRLTGHGQADLVHAVAAEQTTIFFRGLLDAGDVAQARHIGRLPLDDGRRSAARPCGDCRRGRGRAARADGQLAEVFRQGVGTRNADGVVLVRRFQRPGGQFDVLVRQGRLDVVDRQAPRRHGGGIQPDPHRIALLAIDVDLGHAGHRRHPVDQIAVSVIGQLKPVHAGRAQEDDDDRLAVGIGLGHLGRVGLIGQAADHAADAVAYVVGGVVDVAVQRELDVHVGASVAAGRVDTFDALDAGDLLLYRLGDAALDYLG